MIDPGRGAHVHGGLTRGQTDQFGAEAQGTTAAGTLNGAHPLGREHRMVGAENQLFHGLIECGIARRGHVGLAGLALQDRLFSFPDAVQNRGIPLGIAEYAHPEIHLFRVGVGAECGHQAKNRIVRDAVKTLKHGDASELESGAQVYLHPLHTVIRCN
jgi:hypothetical protein